MYAVIKTGGKQYRVAADQKVQIEKLEGNPGDQVEFTSVLMVSNGSTCLLYTSPSPRDRTRSRMPSSA